ncbi:MAG: hypothetical protein ABI604_00505 [Nitrospirota bacterium]
MSPDNQEEERVVAEAFLNYLADCPQAMDTEEGIAEWWLMRQQAKVAAQTVTKVLKHLIETGRIETVGTGEHTRYRLKS